MITGRAYLYPLGLTESLSHSTAV